MEFILKSSSLANNDLIPQKYTCDGEDISPALEWANPPKGTKSFTLIVNDYGTAKKVSTHWLIYNIPHNVNKLSEGLKVLPQPAKLGLNSWQRKDYVGPCSRQSIHNYHFTLYALDCWLTLRGRATGVSVKKALKHHLLSKATLIACYQRKNSPPIQHQTKIDLEDATVVLRRKDVSQPIKAKAAKELENK